MYRIDLGLRGTPATVLVVDDEPSIRQLLYDWLAEEPGLTVRVAASPDEAEAVLERESVDLLLVDLRLREGSGLEVIRVAGALQPHAVSILITGHPTVETAISALQTGTFDYLIKPFKLELLSATVHRALEHSRLRHENMQLREQVAISEMMRAIGSSLELDQILSLILGTVLREFSAAAVSVLLYDPDTGRMELQGLEGDRAVIRDGPYLEFLRGESAVSSTVLATGRLALLTDRQGDLFTEGAPRHDRLCQPLLVKGRAIGVLNIVRRANAGPCGDGTLRTIEMTAAQAAIAIDNSRLYRNLHAAYLDTVSALANAIEIRDPYTRGHTDRVKLLARALGNRLGWDNDRLFGLWMGCTLHDIGKIGVPDGVLSKPGPLTADEFALMKTHPEIGVKIIEGVPFLKPAIPYVYYHHERYDGSGYPFGMIRDEIPIEGRILAVVDAFDAITSDRPYRRGQSLEVAREELRAFAGIQFDPEIVELFFAALNDVDIPWMKLPQRQAHAYASATF
ncbi:MAG: HD domain-containing phosphohydrolase [Candidatus Zixiibacteriota bacterium]